jgi:hypothetical protein
VFVLTAGVFAILYIYSISNRTITESPAPQAPRDKKVAGEEWLAKYSSESGFHININKEYSSSNPSFPESLITLGSKIPVVDHMITSISNTTSAQLYLYKLNNEYQYKVNVNLSRTRYYADYARDI